MSKVKFDKLFWKKIILFISVTIFLATGYYKILPIIQNYGLEPFQEKDFTKTTSFEEIFLYQIQAIETCVDSGIELDAYHPEKFSFYDRSQSNIEYILDIQKTNGETMLLSNITEDEKELKTLMENFKNSQRYYICKLNSEAETNQEYLERYQFHADQSKFQKLDVYIRIDSFTSDDYIKRRKDNYEDFSYHIPERLAIITIAGIIAILALISITRQISEKTKTKWIEQLSLEEIIVILALIGIIGIRMIRGESYFFCMLANEVKWFIYIISYIIVTKIYVGIVKRVKNKQYTNWVITAKIMENMKKLSPIILIYIISCIMTYYLISQIGNPIGKWDDLAWILIYTIILLNQLRQKIEIIEITKKLQENMKQDNEIKIETQNKWLRPLVDNINVLQSKVQTSIEEKLKSERLKTDLITNVSHDLKTPLTSIINYTDLLKKEKIENENAKKYIHILEEKTKKLKNLTEDLIEASKISSGNETIHLEKLDFKEMILQANGEFAEKLEQRKLELISNLPEENVIVPLDGKKMWRVLENLYQNVVKYSLENTRVYVELEKKNREIIFSMKNISKEKLNISPEELMERFVRGDKSRSTSGSGLGLSISKDLVALQGGRLSIEIQGDLFVIQINFTENY